MHIRIIAWAATLFTLLTISANKRAIAQTTQPSEKPADAASQLIEAAADGDLSKAKTLLEKGTDVNARSHDGSTPLILASQNDRTQIVEVLIKRGADVNISNNGGTTALVPSSFSGYTNVVKILLENGAKVDATDAHGKTAIFYASLAGNDDTVKMLVAHGANIQNKTERSQYIVKGIVTKVNVPGNNFDIKILDGSVVGAGKEAEFSISDSSRIFGGASGLKGLNCLRKDDRVIPYYSGQMTVNNFNYANFSCSVGFSYTAALISIVSEPPTAPAK